MNNTEKLMEMARSNGIAQYLKIRAFCIVITSVFESEEWGLKTARAIDGMARSCGLRFKIKYQYRCNDGTIVNTAFNNTKPLSLITAFDAEKGYQVEALDIKGGQRGQNTQ